MQQRSSLYCFPINLRRIVRNRNSGACISITTTKQNQKPRHPRNLPAIATLQVLAGGSVPKRLKNL